tara:strand:- start:5041 stop:5295 length:255 start_codon:yes stop_codon:yes gene_type:complete
MRAVVRISAGTFRSGIPCAQTGIRAIDPRAHTVRLRDQMWDYLSGSVAALRLRLFTPGSAPLDALTAANVRVESRRSDSRRTSA